MTNVLVLGKGGREHCICEFLKNSPDVEEVYVFPGNDCIVSEKINKVNITNTKENILGFCVHKEIEYVIPSTETYLADGIVDFLESKGIKCFGPNGKNALIESCKIFSKNLMKKYNIKTPDFFVFNDFEMAKNFLISKKEKEYVIKNPNLAGGKGVFIPKDIDDSLNILKELSKNIKSVIIEEKIYGEEVSVLGFCNGKEIELMPQSQDYKKLYDKELGPNTGGMGAQCPVQILNNEEIEIVKTKMNSVVKDLNYKGVLYAGIMKTESDVHFLEFNCRLGDPETQVLLNLLKNDFFTIIKNCIKEQKVKAEWKEGHCLTVALSHTDYPYKNAKKKLELSIGKLDSSIKLYSGNMELEKDKKYSNGGRIMYVTNYSEDPCQNFITVYNNINKINYKNKYFRKDIGINHIKNKIGKKIKVAILGSTKGTSTQKLIKNFKKLNISIELIISNNNKSYILERGRDFKISTFYLNPLDFSTKEDYDKRLINILKIFDVDLILLVGYMKILTKKFTEEYKNKILNVHPSLLPDYKGLMDMEVHKKVIENKEKISGCTVHYVNESVDSGDIVLQKQCIIDKKETPESLKSKVQSLEEDALIESINIFRENKIDYTSTGVDIEEGNEVVKMIKSLSPQLEKDIGHFGCIYEYNGLKLAASTDGVGSKLEIAMELKKFDTIGLDLVAMVVNDLYCCGAVPLFFLDYLAIDKVDKEKCKLLIKGINKGCEISNCKLIGGETAEMPSLYLKDKFDLAGFGVGIVKNQLPKKMEKGDLIYGIRSNGIHSNGFSLVRKLLKSSSYNLDEILTPTRIYSELPLIMETYKETLLGLCHITGGGITENLPRIIPQGLSFKLKDWEFPPIFKWIQKESMMTKEEMLRVFNCGFGMLLVFKKDSRPVIKEELQYLGEIN